MTSGRIAPSTAVVLLTLLVGACSTTCEVANLPPPVQERDALPPQAGKPGRGRPVYKVGDPYQIAGRWYYPKVDYDYDVEGRASWYGRGFNGRLTANGEVFDQNDLSAAHQTLPLPSVVRVTNLENGRSLVLRVNDRGPFVRGRVIDVSKKAAKLLRFHDQGTTKVRVEVLERESRAAASELGARG